MSDISVRMTLNDDVSAKLNRIAQAGRTTATQLTNSGRAMDHAFRSTSLDHFAGALSDAAEEAEDSIGSLGDAINDVSDSLGGWGSSGSDWMDDLSDAAEDAEDSMDSLRRSTEEFSDGLDGIGDGAGGLDDFSDSASEAGDSMDSASTSAGGLGSALQKLITIVAGAAVLDKIKEFGIDSVQTFMGLESGMAEVATLLPDASDLEMQGMTQQVRDLSLETGKLTSEIVPALYQSISASVPKDNVFEFLEIANMAAVGGVTEMETAVDGITSVINAYGTDTLSAAEASDQMFTAVKLGKTSFGELASSLFNVIPTAVNAGVSFGDITAAIATMTASGTPTSVATTQMRQALVELSDTGTDVGAKFAELSGKGFKEFIAEGHHVDEALNLLTDNAKESGLTIDQLFGSVEAGNAAAQLTGGHAKTFADDIAAMGASAGATEAAYGKMTDTFQHKTDLLSAAWEDVKISSGESLAEALAPAADSLLENMDDIKEPVTEFFSEIGELISDLTPLLPGFLDALSGGLRTAGKVIGPLAEMFAENPEAVGKGLTGIATGMLAFKGINKVSGFLDGVSGVSGALKALAPTIFAHPWAAGAAAVVGAVTAIGMAVHEYNEMQIQDNLESHFGDISLTADQARGLAEQIIPMGVTAQLQLANVSFEEADNLIKEAEALLEENDFINWKVQKIGLDMSEADETTLLQNTGEFVSKVESALEKEEYSAELAVKALLGETDSTQLISEMQSWFKEDMDTVQTLGAAVTDLLQKSINEGVNDVNTQTAIEIMQAKMLQIAEGEKMAELEAKKDWLNITSSGAALDQESFVSVIGQLDELREAQKEADAESYQGLLAYFERAAANGHIGKSQKDGIMDVIGKAVAQQDSSGLASSWEWISTSMNDAYGKELTALKDAMDGASFKEQITGAGYDSGLTPAMINLQAALDEQFESLDAGTRGALEDRYKAMHDTIQGMDDIITEAAQKGEAVPETLMQSYNEAMKMGAAAGDEEAMWQYMASSIAQDFPSMDEFMSTLEANGVNFSDWPEEVQNSFEKAFVETDSSLDFTGMLNDLVNGAAEDGTVDLTAVGEILNKYGVSIQDYLDGHEVDAEGHVKMKAGDVEISDIAQSLDGLNYVGQTTLDGGEIALQYTVNEGETLSGIMEQYGVVWSQVEQQIQKANPEISDLNLIYPDQVVNIPKAIVEAASVDASQVGEAAEEAAKSETGEVIETEQPVEVVLTDAGTDVSQLGESTATTDVTVKAGNVDSSQVTEATRESVSKDPVPGEQTVDVTASAGQDNYSETAAEFATRFDSALKTAFNQTFTATANALITVDYTLANPSKEITFTGGATGTATVYAHAEGGIFDTPHYGVFAEAGPEAFIPLDGSDHSVDLWKQAGEYLGVVDQAPIPVPTGATSNTSADSAATGGRSARDINININGNGKVSFSGGVSAEDVENLIMDNIRGAIRNIIEEDILVEGDGSYEY